MADKDLLYFNQTSAQWELVNSGAISDGTNTITPNKIGLLTNLTTTDKTSIVNAVNETKATATAALPKAGGTMTGSLGLLGTGTNDFRNGNGDTASYTNQNVRMHLHYGLGFETYDGTIQGYYDSRLGKWDVKDGYYVNGTKMAQTRVNAGGYVEWNNGGTWYPVGGNIPVGRARSVGPVMNGASGTWVTVLNVTGVSGRLEQAYYLCQAGSTSSFMRVTIDGAAYEEVSYGANTGGGQIQVNFLTEVEIGSDGSFYKPSQEAIYFNSSLKIEVMGTGTINAATGYATYRLRAGTA